LRGDRTSKTECEIIAAQDQALIEDTFSWPLRGDLTSETESEIIAAQDQALQTKYHAEKETDSQCRLC
jgi:hypothetical protein